MFGGTIRKTRFRVAAPLGRNLPVRVRPQPILSIKPSFGGQLDICPEICIGNGDPDTPFVAVFAIRAATRTAERPQYHGLLFLRYAVGVDHKFIIVGIY